MNAGHLLEVATKDFVNRDQEAKREANRKMKRKIDFLAAAIVEQSGRPWQANPGRGNHHGWRQETLGHLTPGRN
jgi:hypothetical protein